MAGLPRRDLHLVEFAESRSAELLDVDRRITAHGGHRPRRLEEFPAGLDQVGRPGTDLFRVADQHRRAVGQLIGQQRQVVGPQHRQQCLHAVDRDALGELGQHVADTAADPVLGRRLMPGQLGRPRPHLVGQQQLAARDRDQAVDADFGNRPLVGHREHPHLGDLVTPELHPHRMLSGRGENVENAAADREFATPTDHVDAGVSQLDQPGDDPFESAVGTRVVADGQAQWFHQAQARSHRLQQRAHRGDHHLQRRAEPAVLRVGQPAQQHHPGADGVDAGRESLVGQRLPGREHRDRIAEDTAQLGGQVVGFAAGGRDDQQRTVAGQRAGDEQPGAGRADQRQLFGSIGGQVDESLQRRRAQRQLHQPRDRGHYTFWPRCGHDAAIVWVRSLVNFEASTVKEL